MPELLAGSGITLTPDVGTGTLTVSAGDGVTPQQFGAVGDGATNDRAALQAALNTGKLVVLQHLATYLIDSGLDHVTGSGFVCSGRATIKAKTGAGGFNVTSAAAPRTGLDRNMLRCNGTDDITLRNVHFTTDGANEVVLHGVRLHGGMATAGYDIQGISFSGFFNGSMVVMSSVGAGKKRIIGIASATDGGITQGSARFTAGAQTTVVEIDNDLVSSAASVGGAVSIGLIKNILYTGQALTDFGQQTDGVNIVCQGANSTHDWAISIDEVDGVGEPIDIQGWRNSVRIGTIRNAYNYAVKLIHGGRDNEIEVGTIYRSGIAAVLFSGSTSVIATTHTQGNYVKVGTIVEPGAYGLGLTTAAGDVTAVTFGGSNATWKPKSNVCEIGTVTGDGTNLDWVVKDGGTDAGNDNLVSVSKASGMALGSVSAPKGNVRVKYLSRCFVDMTMSTAPSITTATATKLPFDTVVEDTEGIAVTASNKVTMKWPGIYRLRAQIRMDSWKVGAADHWQLDIKQNATVIRTTCDQIKFSGKDETGQIDVPVYVDEDDIGTANADYTVWLTQDTGASKTLSNATSYTRLNVQRVS